MKDIIAAAVLISLALGATATQAQERRSWTDRSGALAIDLEGTDWFILDVPSSNPEVVLRLVSAPADDSEGLHGHCSLEQANRPSPRPATQLVANEMARIAAEIDQTRRDVEQGANATRSDVREQDGVLSIYTPKTWRATRGEEFRGFTREFILSRGATLDYVIFTCLIRVRADEREVRALPAFLDRLRIAQGSPP